MPTQQSIPRYYQLAEFPTTHNNQPPESTKPVHHLIVITCTQRMTTPSLIVALTRPLRRPSNHEIVEFKSHNNGRNIGSKQQSTTTTHNNPPPDSKKLIQCVEFESHNNQPVKQNQQNINSTQQSTTPSS